MNIIIPRRTHVRRRWIGLVMALITAGVAVLNPAPALAATAEAAAVACRLAPRLHVGDAVSLVKGQPNRIRQAPSLAAAHTAFRISAGEVWHVLAGPVCQDGMRDTGDLAYSFRAVDMLVCQVVARRGDW